VKTQDLMDGMLVLLITKNVEKVNISLGIESFNWVSYAGEKDRNYEVEEGTQFFHNVEEFWNKVFDDDQLDKNLNT